MAEKPQPTDVKLGSSALFISQACGRCQHFRKIAHPAYEKPCEVLGILRESKPCERFSPDAGQLRLTSERHARLLGDALRDLGETDLLALASLAAQERKTRRYGFRYGDTVYLQAFGGDYLSNYRRAKVTKADAKYIYIQADDGFTAMVFHDSVLTAAQWVKKKTWLENHERLVDPRYAKYVKVPSSAELQAERVRISRDALDLNVSNGGDFTEGARPNKRRMELPELLAGIESGEGVSRVMRIR